MKICVLSLFILGWTGGLSFSQEPASSPPALPAGPLLKRAPDFSTWTVLTRKSSTKPESQESPSDQDASRPQRQVAVTKTGRVIHEITVDSRGKSTDVWHVGGVQVTVPAGGGTPAVFPDAGGGDIYTANYAVSDFAGLEWVSAATYTGIQKVMGRDCIIFRSEVDMLPRDERMEAELEASRAVTRKLSESRKKGGAANTRPDLPATTAGPKKSPTVACIDLETRLPLVVTFSKETRIYQFGRPPGEMQALPASLAAALSEFQTRIQGLAKLPARP